MPAQVIGAHSKAIWPESSASGVVLDNVPMYLVASGADVVFSAIGPAQFAFYLVGGDYVLANVTSPPSAVRLDVVQVGDNIYFF
jgi:hypothetical protein